MSTVQYNQKKEAQLKRETPATVTSTSQEASNLPDDETSDPEAYSEDKEDEEDEEMNRRPKRSKLVDIQLPRNIMASPQVTAAMDRTNTSPAQAMHLISAVFKSAQKDGKSLDLNEVTISQSTIRRGREKAREEICRQQYLATLAGVRHIPGVADSQDSNRGEELLNLFTSLLEK